MKVVNPLEALRQRVASIGTQQDAAKEFGISGAYLSDLLNGRRDITDKMLAKLNLKRVVVK